jgi:hypothetical protein
MRPVIVAGMLVLAVSASLTSANAAGPPRWMPRYEIDCDSSARGLPGYAGLCHCRFECRRQIGSYTVRLPCLNKTPPFCEQHVVPLDAFNACWHQCVKAKDPSKLPRPRGALKSHCDRASSCREVNQCHKHAAATALAIALNITMLTPAVSAGGVGALLDQDGWFWRVFMSLHPTVLGRLSVFGNAEALQARSIL